MGYNSMKENTEGFDNTGIGKDALSANTTGSKNTAIGFEANVGAANLTNATAIGASAIVNANNTIQLGNSAVTDVKTSGALTSGTITYPKVHGTAGQVLTTSGTSGGAATWQTLSAVTTVGAISTTATTNGATITGNNTLNLTPADATNGGVVTNGTQTFAGNKSFAKAVTNSTAFNASAGTTIDFSNSNLAYTSANPGAFTLTNLKDGGTYTLAVRGTSSGTASFTASGFTIVSLGNFSTIAGKKTVYTFVVMGTEVYFSMVSEQ